jgi:hypothetical protein
MSSPSSISYIQPFRQPTHLSHPFVVQRALSKGRKASDDFKDSFHTPNTAERLITAGRHIEGVFQDFLIHGASSVGIF